MGQDDDELQSKIAAGESPLFVHQVLKYTRAWKDYNEPDFNPANDETSLADIEEKQLETANLNMMVSPDELEQKMKQLGLTMSAADLEEQLREAGGLQELEDKVWGNYLNSLKYDGTFDSEVKNVKTVKQRALRFSRDPREDETVAQNLIPQYLRAQRRLQATKKSRDQARLDLAAQLEAEGKVYHHALGLAQKFAEHDKELLAECEETVEGSSYSHLSWWQTDAQKRRSNCNDLPAGGKEQKFLSRSIEHKDNESFQKMLYRHKREFNRDRDRDAKMGTYISFLHEALEKAQMGNPEGPGENFDPYTEQELQIIGMMSVDVTRLNRAHRPHTRIDMSHSVMACTTLGHPKAAAYTPTPTHVYHSHNGVPLTNVWPQRLS